MGGYGYAQLQYKQIQGKLDAMVEAQELIVAQNEERIAASQEGLNAVQAEAWEQYGAFVEARCDEWDAAVDAQNAWWAQNVADRTATVEAGIDAAAQAVADALAVKLAEFDRM